MNTWGTAAVAVIALMTLGGCSSDSEPEAETTTAAEAPSDPLDQMLISFNGSPSKIEIQQAMDDALNATDTAISDDMYSRAGSVLVSFREEYGVDEMEILDCMPTATTDPRLPEVTFPNVAAVCVTDIAEGVR